MEMIFLGPPSSMALSHPSSSGHPKSQTTLGGFTLDKLAPYFIGKPGTLLLGTQSTSFAPQILYQYTHSKGSPMILQVKILIITDDR